MDLPSIQSNAGAYSSFVRLQMLNQPEPPKDDADAAIRSKAIADTSTKLYGGELTSQHGGMVIKPQTPGVGSEANGSASPYKWRGAMLDMTA
mgnify:CR=1 FL=1